MILPIVIDPAPILHRRARPVRPSAELLSLADSMLETMRASRGVGLAAPQINQDIRLLVAAYAGDSEAGEPALPDTALLNPRIMARSKEQSLGLEGCLSLPGIELPIWRADRITVEAELLDGQAVSQKYHGFAARVLQHEIDHLDGVLITDRVEPFSVVFMGTPEFAVPTLAALHQHSAFRLLEVVTETDKPSGRGQRMISSPVKRYAEQIKIPIWQPKSLKTTEAVSHLQALQPDFIIVTAYGKILPANVLAVPKHGAINVHASLLPRFRGASPIQATVLAGDAETGVTIMQMDVGLDTGSIISQEKLLIAQGDSTGSLSAKLAELGARLLPISVIYLLSGLIVPKKQPKKGVTETHRLNKEDGRIDWMAPAEQIDRQVRAMNPWPGAWAEAGAERILIHSGLVKDGRYVPTVVQLAGRNPADRRAFERGWRGGTLPWAAKS